MTGTRWVALGLSLGLALGASPAAAELRPMARPATLAPPPEPPAEPPTGPPTEDGAVPAALPAPDAAAPTDPAVGPESGLPLPRYVSLKGSEGNARRGPTMGHRIDWVFLRRGMPLRVTAEHDNWRRVEDADGLGGWVHYALLSGTRSVLVLGGGATLRARPDADAQAVARLEPGVIADLLGCEPAWCRLDAGGYGGWVEKAALWGVDPDEVLD